ncbi:vitamin B12 import system permease protein btuC [Corynebacterium kutscheri]|uniref:ABC-type Fe3+-siderophore transport system, permease component n=1 Tax=Corynebacterium kutscheri TaxID=35755 RepID=A0A0F6TCS7_9CORY|nr:iron ABC transporter permease [Corynebacterium kutscheri]AKE41116.1 ABC-type Fe3+-siderophore transport system, permease component [Corynebacterium kutscheri]VEH07024.1 vitamin B12 import system permease protein btuC [Corynebacterium kutscheri]VEH09434.1 vitamin B12 import system permease protein btuC [Corynebacterium kutscheri]VEH79520.1 vitamin B12 import system permease protein btuC [Corynebacterium kutscheri]
MSFKVTSALSVVLILLLIVGIVFGVASGVAELSPATVFRSLIGDAPDPITYHIVVSRRLPRVLSAVIAGAGLALCGAILQTLTQNPLADPYILGISGGSFLGAALVITGGITLTSTGSFSAIAIAAFIGGILSLLAVFSLSTTRAGTLEPQRMILAGIAIGQLSSAGASALIYFSDKDAAQRIQAWSLGSLAGSQWSGLPLSATIVGILLCAALCSCRALDGFSFGTEAAKTLGVNVNVIRWTLYITVSLTTATLVAQTGIIGFVGLVIPHFVRMIVGPLHGYVIPLSALIGSVFLVWTDITCRVAFSPRELPLGLITATIGVPAFLFVLHKQRQAHI